MNFEDSEDFADFFESEAEAATYIYEGVAEAINWFCRKRPNTLTLTHDHWQVELNNDYGQEEIDVTICVTLLRGKRPLGYCNMTMDNGSKISIYLDHDSGEDN